MAAYIKPCYMFLYFLKNTKINSFHSKIFTSKTGNYSHCHTDYRIALPASYDIYIQTIASHHPHQPLSHVRYIFYTTSQCHLWVTFINQGRRFTGAFLFVPFFAAFSSAFWFLSATFSRSLSIACRTGSTSLSNF